jgi:O-methyltransferase
MSEAARLYIELLKRCVTNAIYDDDLDLMRGQVAVDEHTGKYVPLEGVSASMEDKYLGLIWPSRAHTMIGVPRLENLQRCAEDVLQAGVPGDFIETGVWRGGAAIFMRGILKAYGVTDRTVWVADSFEGLPPADPGRYPKESPMEFHRYEALAVSLDEVRANFARYGLLDEQVRFLKGWFRDTLPGAPIERLAILRLDGDLYESTMDGLALYQKLSPGGYVIVDDYNLVEACNEAVHDFLRDERITAPLNAIPGGGAFWKK